MGLLLVLYVMGMIGTFIILYKISSVFREWKKSSRNVLQTILVIILWPIFWIATLVLHIVM